MYKELYSANEWQTLQFATLWVLAGVGGVDNDIDEKEVSAFAKDVSEWARSKEPMTQEVLLSVANNFQDIFAQYDNDPRDVKSGLSEVVKILKHKATLGQTKGFKDAMLLIGRNVADASGGLFDRGDNISAKEKAALEIIITALDA